MVDINSGRCIKEFTGHEKNVESIIVSKDGKNIISASKDGMIIIWDTTTGENKKIQEESPTLIESNVQNQFISFTYKTIKIWDTKQGKCIGSYEDEQGDISCVTESRDYKKIIFVDHKNCLKVLEREITDSVEENSLGWSGLLFGIMAFIPPNPTPIKQLKLVPIQNTFKKLNVRGVYQDNKKPIVHFLTKLRQREGYLAIISQATHTQYPGNRWSGVDLVEKIEILNEKHLDTTHLFDGHHDHIKCVIESPDGKNLISASNDKTIKVWDIETRQCVRTLQGHTEEVTSIKSCIKGKFLISCSEDKTLKIWDLHKGECIFSKQYPEKVHHIFVTPDDTKVILTCRDFSIKVLDIRNLQPASLAKITNS